MEGQVDYKKLWKLLIDKEMKKTDLIPLSGISTNILARLGKGEYVSMESLHKICKAFNCDVGDICEMKEEQGIPCFLNVDKTSYSGVKEFTAVELGAEDRLRYDVLFHTDLNRTSEFIKQGVKNWRK